MGNLKSEFTKNSNLVEPKEFAVEVSMRTAEKYSLKKYSPNSIVYRAFGRRPGIKMEYLRQVKLGAAANQSSACSELPEANSDVGGQVKNRK